jgi:hypothetical protein
VVFEQVEPIGVCCRSDCKTRAVFRVKTPKVSRRAGNRYRVEYMCNVHKKEYVEWIAGKA